jgi:hypothetical protein
MFKGLFGKKTQPIPKVKLMGMNERALNLFTMFLNSSAKGLCEIVDDGSHQIVIIDLDAVDNARMWLDVRSQFTGPAIVLSVREQSLTNAFWVSKPVNEDHFKSALDKAQKALSQPPSQPAAVPHSPKAPLPAKTESQTEPIKLATVTTKTPSSTAEKTTAVTSAAAGGMNESLEDHAKTCCGELADEVYRDPKQREQLFFNSSDTVLGLLRQAMTLTKEQGIARIAREGAHPLYVGYAQDFVSSPMHEAYLRAICARNIGESPVKVELVDMDIKTIGASDDVRMRRLDNVLWKTALWSSRGRVERGTSLDAPVRLRAWPNIPRLMSVPDGLRIAALWVTQPTSLLDTARKLGVPYRFVFSFYCACQAFDLVEQLGAAKQSSSIHTTKTMTQE